MNKYSSAFKKGNVLFIFVLINLITILSACTVIGETDPDPDRGAATVKQDIFGDNFTTIQYLEQGWSSADSLWFYTITQGSNMMPYDFFLALEQIGNPEPFRSNENINRYRYLPQNATSSNPDGLPVGFVKDTYKNKEFLGLTCSACHTGQINYKGIGIRIDGGPAGADMEKFMADIVRAIIATQRNDEKLERFVKNVLARGNYRSEDEIIAELKKYRERLANYITFNYSSLHYGYARLDAFGRIYNRVLEHVINVRELKQLLVDPRIMGKRVMTEEQINSLTKDVGKVMSGEERDRIFENIGKILDQTNGWETQGHLRKKLFNPPDAPVSYPFLWDTPQHDYVQWNGLTENAGLKAIARNAGEAIGVFGSLDWTENKGFSISALINGQDPFGPHISYYSSVDLQNLRLIEARLLNLQSPVWPQNILPSLDMTRVENGRSLYDKHCESCHVRIERQNPDRRVVAQMFKVNEVGTDPKMAENSVNYQGFSGILRNQYVSVGLGDILLDRRAPVPSLLTKATIGVVTTPDQDKGFLTRWIDWIANLATGFRHNAIKPSIKHGDYDPDTTVNPVASLKSYKARPLNGIWATAPYLHNGSVPTLYDLLLPKKRTGDPEEGEYRPDEFEVGSREFDPVKVGFKYDGYGGFTFNTELKGNGNQGHEYGAKRTIDESNGPVDPKIKEQCTNEAIHDKDLDKTINDKCLYPMKKEERLDLLEYLKTL